MFDPSRIGCTLVLKQHNMSDIFGATMTEPRPGAFLGSRPEGPRCEAHRAESGARRAESGGEVPNGFDTF